MRFKIKGLALIGVYYIPYSEAAQYKRRMKRAAKEAKKALYTFCPRVEKCFKGSEDGEALVGFDLNNEIMALIHLDPEGLDFIEEGLKNGDLIERLRKGAAEE